MIHKTLFTGIVLAIAFLPAAGESASHQWRFNEVFSNTDGSVQFIEMKECCGFSSEHELSGKWLQAVAVDRRYSFRGNLTGDTANRHLLLATQGFADLPGAPTPDFILPDGFLPVAGETLEYWMYTNATWTYGALPTDGVTAMNADGSTTINSPTNYAGDSGSVNANVPVRAMTWGQVKASGLRIVLR